MAKTIDVLGTKIEYSMVMSAEGLMTGDELIVTIYPRNRRMDDIVVRVPRTNNFIEDRNRLQWAVDALN